MEAFMFYIDNWLSSPHIHMMDAAEERGYFRLLLYAAKQDDAGLPDDDVLMAGISLLGSQWNKPTADKSKRQSGVTSGQKIRQCFFGREGRLFNQRLLGEFERWMEVKSKRSAAARAANDKRWGKSDLDSIPYPNEVTNGSDSTHNQIQTIGGKVERLEFRSLSEEEVKNLSEEDLNVAYFSVFVFSGKALNEVDKRKFMHQWLSIERDQQELAYLDAQSKATDGRWPSATLTPLPVNHLRDRPWTRTASERTLPTVERERHQSGGRSGAFDSAR